MGEIQKTLEAKLRAAFDPVSLVLENDSHRHHGHAGDNGSGESHFSLTIVAEAFEGKSRVARQRLINTVLAKDLAETVHALSIRAQAPSELSSLKD